jgi:hypothetical protein
MSKEKLFLVNMTNMRTFITQNSLNSRKIIEQCISLWALQI